MAKKKLLIFCNLCLLLCFVAIALACGSTAPLVGSDKSDDGSYIEKYINDLEDTNTNDITDSNDEVA